MRTECRVFSTCLVAVKLNLNRHRLFRGLVVSVAGCPDLDLELVGAKLQSLPDADTAGGRINAECFCIGRRGNRDELVGQSAFGLADGDGRLALDPATSFPIGVLGSLRNAYLMNSF